MANTSRPSSTPAGHLLPASGEKERHHPAVLVDDVLARFAYVDPEDSEEDISHVHSSGCACHLRGV